jgi:D-alanine--poly(phosphoribitol) ligase subunit 1
MSEVVPVQPSTDAAHDLLALVLAHADRRPDAPALQDDIESFTYSQLAERVALVSAGLAGLGVAEGDRVALHLGNSAAFVTFALGCLWAGAAFVPVAHDSPPARYAEIFDDCDPSLVVTANREGLGQASSGTGHTVTPGEVLGAASRPPPRSLDPERDAYLIYTSGTTGRPKGVRIPERSFYWSVLRSLEGIGLSTSTRAMPVSAFNFDGGYAVVFPTLVAGGLVVVPRREDLLFLKRFYQVIMDEEINYTGCTPSYLRLVMSGRAFGKLAESKLVNWEIGGEQLVAEDVAKLWTVLPNIRVFNHYGPTETTITVTNYRISAEDVASGWVPIGQPHPGVDFYIVDEEGRLIDGTGTTGELFIGGEQLMRGYWGDKELSQSVLRQDVVAGRTVYKTGDLVRRDDRGRYVYIGRMDDVIKRSGIRISLSEVALAFRGGDGVTGAFCALVDRDGSPGIAAFVEAGPGTTVPELLEGARRKLPEAMLPDELFVVGSLPMTAQGKVDRRLLLANAGRAAWRDGPAV